MIHLRIRSYGQDWTDIWFDGELEDELANILLARLAGGRPDLELDLEPQDE